MREGAFTGASGARRGLFEEATGGTMFLDEIGDIGPKIQSQLLRALQEGEIRRVGESTPIRVDVRMVAATNKDLKARVADGKFREDLLYRLDVVHLHLPPLRERREDIPALVDHFAALHARGGARPVVTEEAMARLVAYDWPGNVRQLENVVARALALNTTGVLGPADFPEPIGDAPKKLAGLAADMPTLAELNRRYAAARADDGGREQERGSASAGGGSEDALQAGRGTGAGRGAGELGSGERSVTACGLLSAGARNARERSTGRAVSRAPRVMPSPCCSIDQACAETFRCAVPPRTDGAQLRASLHQETNPMATPTEDVVGKLNSFLRGEISAVETYKQALDKVTDPAIRSQLQSCEEDHEQRVELLRARITELGGKPDTGSGAWGVWAKLVQGGGNLLGEKTALQALEEGEDHGLNDYRRDLDELDSETRTWVESNLLPKAEQTHGALSTLKRTVH